MLSTLQTCYIFRICAILVLTFIGVGLSLVAFKTDISTASSNLPMSERLNSTLTHTLYLPAVYYEPTCTNPPSGTAAILGQATVHGNSAGPNISFVLSYRAHWEYPPSRVLTMTTNADGSFCSGPVTVLSYCHGMWYEIYEPSSSWRAQVFACESGKVYTVSAEIGE
jgi:hypothetical protein